jgi:hypothetical protein
VLASEGEAMAKVDGVCREMSEKRPRNYGGRHFCSEAGIGLWTTLVFGSIVGAVVYLTFEIAPFFYYFVEIQNHMKSLVAVGNENTDEELRAKLWQQVKWYEIPADKEDIQIERRADTLSIHMDYEEVFTLYWGDKLLYERVFPFHPEADGPL